MPNNLYTPLSDLVDASAIPGDIEFIENGAQAVIDTLLSKIFYKDLVTQVSDKGDSASYSLTLMTKSLRQPLFGTGMELVFFKGAEHDFSDFPVKFDWRWPIKKYFAGFEAEGFSYAPEAFIEILFEMAGIQDKEEFFGSIVNTFLDDGTDAYVAFFNEITSTLDSYDDHSAGVSTEIQSIKDNLAIIKNEVDSLVQNSNFFTIKNIFDTYRDNQVIQPAVDAVKTSIENLLSTFDIDIDVYTDFVKAVLKEVSDIDEKFDRLLLLFKGWLGDITWEHLKSLLIPQFAAELDGINMALEFPRDYLLPMIQSGGVWQADTNEDNKAALIFTAGNIKYSTQSGFNMSIDEDNEIDLPRCMIPDLGMQLELKKIKLDLSRSSNISEATADGRPDEFIGAYIQEADIYLPDEWFKFDEDGSTLKLFGRDIIAGTGGLSGTIGVESVSGIDAKLIPSMLLTDGRNLSITPGADGVCNEGDVISINGSTAEAGKYILNGGGSIEVDDQSKIKRFISSDGEISFNLGKSGGSGSWKIGFSQFYMKFHQNSIVDSEIKGSLTIPNFKQEGKTGDLKIDIDVFFEKNGDFRITASPEGGLILCLGNNGSVFKLKIDSLEAGKDDDKVYVKVSGAFDFSANALLSSVISKPIEVKKLKIYSDGSFEIEGGSIPIPGSINMKLGPVEVDITNITLGGEKLDKGNYKFIGFDCGVSTGSGGLDLRGDGIKIYFNHDGSDMFLRIAGIGIDLVIPGTATEETAALIIKGYLSLKEDEYTGSVAFKLPKANIAGGAAMKMKPKIPAFAIDAFLELAAPIPLGTTGLGIFGFRGLFGLRYIADLPPGATSDPDKMFEFYTDKKPDPMNAGALKKGLHLGKIVTPEDRADGFKSSGTPISIGAGVSIGTAPDAGRAFSMQAFLFLSLPEFLMISGKGNILSERVSIVSDTEPPFFAYLAITGEYISIGMGADYKIREDGEVLDLHAEAQMAFFFKDPSAWYIHFGTKDKPNQAKILKKIFNLNAYAYLMLSAAGIETGAGIKFDMSKKYGPVKVAVKAYGDIYAMISFRQVQAGGGIACGGSVEASVFGVGFNISLDAYLMATAPTPFIVKGGARICLEVDFWLYTWSECINIDFSWRFNSTPNTDPIGIIAEKELIPVSGFHIGSKNTYPIAFFPGGLPSPSDANIYTIPLDTFIDIQLKKAVNPVAVNAKIGGYTNGPVSNIEMVPPKEVELQVSHRFEISDINIKVWNAGSSTWVNYNPYEALDPGSFLQNVNPADLKLGYWQKKAKEYNNLRLLSNTPFSYTDNMSGGFIPEQAGITAGTLFCRDSEISCHCTTWVRTNIYLFNKWYAYRDINFKVSRTNASSVAFPNIFNIPYSLRFNNRSSLEIILPKKSLKASLKLFSFAKKVIVSFYDLQDITVIKNGNPVTEPQYILIKSETLTTASYTMPVKYADNHQTIKKIIIEPEKADDKEIFSLENDIILLMQRQIAGDKEAISKARKLLTRLETLRSLTCNNDQKNPDHSKEISALEKELKKLNDAIKNIRTQKEKYCNAPRQFEHLIDLMQAERKAYIHSSPALPAKDKEHTIRDKNAEKAMADLRKLKEKHGGNYYSKLESLIIKTRKELIRISALCKELTADYLRIMGEIRELTGRITDLKTQTGIVYPAGTDRCSTYIHEVCYLTQEEYWYNQAIPSQAAIDGDYNTMSDAVSKVIAPIWRPDETYAIEVKTNEIVGFNNNDTAHAGTAYFAFKTSGTIGHFPLSNLTAEVKKQFSLDSNGVSPEHSSDGSEIKIEIPENALKFYIDFNKSYPNPIGNIINQKPLYYQNAGMLLYYTEPFVYHFFNNWPDYAGLGKRFSSMDIVIKDPSENPLPPANPAVLPVLNVLPLALANWVLDIDPPVPAAVDIINSLRDPRLHNPAFNGQTCWQIGGDPIKPASKNTEVVMKNLKPSKLYNAIIFSKYSKTGPAADDPKQIHSYPFQTSRYADLADQVNSYHLKQTDHNTGEVLSTKDALYDLPVNLGMLGITIGDLTAVAAGTDVTGNIRPALIQNYPDTFQRLFFGYLQMEPLFAVMNTEIHILRNVNNDPLAIYIRNPEPFNDPRIPQHEIVNSVELLINNHPVHTMLPAFSKDNSEMLLFYSFPVHTTRFKIRFNYLLWNGTAYTKAQTVTTDNIFL